MCFSLAPTWDCCSNVYSRLRMARRCLFSMVQRLAQLTPWRRIFFTRSVIMPWSISGHLRARVSIYKEYNTFFYLQKNALPWSFRVFGNVYRIIVCYIFFSLIYQLWIFYDMANQIFTSGKTSWCRNHLVWCLVAAGSLSRVLPSDIIIPTFFIPDV